VESAQKPELPPASQPQKLAADRASRLASQPEELSWALRPLDLQQGQVLQQRVHRGLPLEPVLLRALQECQGLWLLP
jgi:hypothetical protein